MSKVQTDNSYFSEKVYLRLQSLASLQKSHIRVLEAFAGDGKIWSEVRRYSDKRLSILKIDQKPDKEGVYLKGDNVKFLKGFDLTNFDIIDLDAYGSPFKQLEIVLKSKFTGIIHCTFIQSGMGRIDNKLLHFSGFSKEMILQCPTLLCRYPMKLMENYLFKNGIGSITGYFFGRKNYFHFHKSL